MWGLIVKWGAWGASALMGGGRFQENHKMVGHPPHAPPVWQTLPPREW